LEWLASLATTHDLVQIADHIYESLHVHARLL